jgi:protein gp37
MSKDTLIQYCDSTVNPSTGCDGCELWGSHKSGPCYAGHIHQGRMAAALPELYDPDFTVVREAPGRMREAAAWPDLRGKARPDKPWLNGMPRTIFIGDMGDIFSKAISFDYILREVIQTVISEKGYRHIWMLLTKRGRRMADFARWLATQGWKWPPNLWAGVSVTGKATMRRIDGLLELTAPVRYVSFEPLYESVDLGCVPGDIRWAIIGGESQQEGVEPQPFGLDWARKLIGQCAAAGVPVFMKQIGSLPYEGEGEFIPTAPDRHPDPWKRSFDGSNMLEWPADIRVRRMPEWPDWNPPGRLF